MQLVDTKSNYELSKLDSTRFITCIRYVKLTCHPPFFFAVAGSTILLFFCLLSSFLISPSPDIYWHRHRHLFPFGLRPSLCTRTPTIVPVHLWHHRLLTNTCGLCCYWCLWQIRPPFFFGVCPTSSGERAANQWLPV